ncbi:MAG: DUF21 domain-containing protein [Nitrospiraceae bacterium]|nr:DUF21 domain-containing protein [Nitrospiraceae bacterium]
MAVGCILFPALSGEAAPHVETAADGTVKWDDILPPSVCVAVLCLLVISAFFSSTETAFLSIPRPLLRKLRDESTVSARLVVQMLDSPGRLLTTILVGNMLVNTLIGVVLGTRVKDLFLEVAGIPPSASYALSIVVTTSALLFFGEITPKIMAVRARERWALLSVFPLLAVGRVIGPLRDGLLWFTDQLFRVTRFHELRAAPFITDDELKSVLSNGDAEDEVEEDGRQMIRNILEFHDAQLREIIVPRPDVVAVSEDATVGEALELYRTHEFSRMPVYRGDIDHITGVLFAKEMLPSVTTGDLARPVSELARPPHFVPETMAVQEFIKSVQRLRSHLAIVVDEFGGTEGIVTLQDAIEEVVGDITVEGEEEERLYEKVGEGVYRVQGGLPLDEFAELTGVDIEDDEHQTVAGYLMGQEDKLPEAGDRFVRDNVTYTVEAVEGRRLGVVRVEIGGTGRGDTS